MEDLDRRILALLARDGRMSYTDVGRETKALVESLTDDLAAPPYDGLDPTELDQLVTDLEPVAAVLAATGSR